MKPTFLLLLTAALAFACSSRRAFPSFGNLADASSYALVKSAPAPGGSGNSARYWLYGGEGEFADLKRDLSATYVQHNWRIINDKVADEISFMDANRQTCVEYSNFRSSAQSNEYVLYDLAETPRTDVDGYKTLVLVVATGCG